MDTKEKSILNTIREFAKELPKLLDGRIDYSNSDITPVITLFIKYKDKILYNFAVWVAESPAKLKKETVLGIEHFLQSNFVSLKKK
ncbi:MAG: hypothetical protein WBC21_00590 [Minisyncoccales bacterium]